MNMRAFWRAMRWPLTVMLLLPGAAVAGADPMVVVEDHRKTYVAQGSYEDVRDSLEYAITGQGIVINNISHIGDMLSRTAGDIGASVKVYEKAEAFEFCSAILSRRMMEADRHNIVFCPFIITLYALPGEEGRVYLSYRRPLRTGEAASDAALKDVERLLNAIIEEAIQ